MAEFAAAGLDTPRIRFEPRTAILRFATAFPWIGAVIAAIAGAVHRALRTTCNRPGAPCKSEAAR